MAGEVLQDLRHFPHRLKTWTDHLTSTLSYRRSPLCSHRAARALWESLHWSGVQPGHLCPRHRSQPSPAQPNAPRINRDLCSHYPLYSESPNHCCQSPTRPRKTWGWDLTQSTLAVCASTSTHESLLYMISLLVYLWTHMSVTPFWIKVTSLRDIPPQLARCFHWRLLCWHWALASSKSASTWDGQETPITNGAEQFCEHLCAQKGPRG
jgi:hypothetical protein